MALILDGKALAAAITKDLKTAIARERGRKPRIAFLLVGDDSASTVYVKMKKRACEEIGIEYTGHELPASTDESKILDLIERFNRNPSIDGILVQLPLPPHIDTRKVMYIISPAKDVDGFHPVNVGKTLLGDKDCFFSCTPLGIKTLLQHYEIDIAGKHAVIIGRSNIVGKPLAAILMQNAAGCNATVTVLHKSSRHFKEICRSADILIAAAGSPGLVTADMVKDNVVIVDVGTNRVNGKLVGDVDFAACFAKAFAITPVPGGVGPMTIAMLMQNTYKSFRDGNGVFSPE